MQAQTCFCADCLVNLSSQSARHSTSMTRVILQLSVILLAASSPDHTCLCRSRDRVLSDQASNVTAGQPNAASRKSPRATPSAARHQAIAESVVRRRTATNGDRPQLRSGMHAAPPALTNRQCQQHITVASADSMPQAAVPSRERTRAQQQRGARQQQPQQERWR